jgi:hypothetical protein
MYKEVLLLPFESSVDKHVTLILSWRAAFEQGAEMKMTLQGVQALAEDLTGKGCQGWSLS